MSRENPNLETPLSDDAGERKISLENNEKDKLSDSDESTVSAKEMIEKLRKKNSNEKSDE